MIRKSKMNAGTVARTLKKRAIIKVDHCKSALELEYIEKPTATVIRCDWVNNDPLYIAYHDEEWGIPEFNSERLFEVLCLEGQQAGLSWYIILKKREAYRKLFYNFNPHKVCNLDDNDVKKIMQDPGIVRYKAKIEAIITNAKCFLKMKNNDEEFSNFIWGFVDHKPVINTWIDIKQVPSKTPESDELSKALKKRGFKFIGSTVCYAFMQACGLVNDHIINCFCHKKVEKH